MKRSIIVFAAGFVILAGNVHADEAGNYDPNYYLENRERMSEVVTDLGLSDDDQREVVDHVIDEGGESTGEGLRDSGMSDEGWEQVMDDANID